MFEKYAFRKRSIIILHAGSLFHHPLPPPCHKQSTKLPHLHWCRLATALVMLLL